MARRKLAVITARADDAEQKEVLRGIAQAAFAENVDVVVYSNLYNHWSEDPQLTFENIIYSLFEPDWFVGAILMPEPLMNPAVLDGVVEKLNKAKLPAVVIGGELGDFPCIQSEDDADLERITEHLITVHGLSHFDVLTGRRNDAVAQKRLAGCIRALQRHGIPLTEEHIIYGNFWIDSGETLAREYLSGTRALPQAVICTNDHMAYGLCDALLAGGVSIPGDVSVTGYDCSSGPSGSRIYHHPLLTTFRRDRCRMGVDAVNRLLDTNYDVTDTDRFISGSTCSCGARQEQILKEQHVERVRRDQAIASSVAHFSSRLTLCQTLAEYTGVLHEFFYLLYGAESLCLCLDTAWNSPKFDGREYLCCRITEERGCSAPVRVSKPMPLAAFGEEPTPTVCYFSPVCFQQRLFGFTVLGYSRPVGYEVSFRDFNKTIADMLEFLRMKNDIHYLTQCQRASTLYDSLTGFYNLREFKQILNEVDGEVTLRAIKLRFIIDGEFEYGENFRSDILTLVAKVIKRTCTRRELHCRANDDTFLILCKHDEPLFSQRLQAMLNHTFSGQYDERQVLISCADMRKQCAEAMIAELCDAVEARSAHDYAALTQRKQLQYYDALIHLRSGVYTTPHRAPSLSEAGKQLCVSEGYFRTIYRRCFGVSYNQECITARLLKACYLLSETAMSVYSVALDCGYTDEKFFARQFRQNIGCSPVEYRKSRNEKPQLM